MRALICIACLYSSLLQLWDRLKAGFQASVWDIARRKSASLWGEVADADDGSWDREEVGKVEVSRGVGDLVWVVVLVLVVVGILVGRLIG